MGASPSLGRRDHALGRGDGLKHAPGTNSAPNVPSAVLEHVWRHENETRFQAGVGEGIFFLNRRFATPPTASGGPLEGWDSGAPENLLIFGVVRPRVAIGSGNIYLLLERA